MRTIQRAHKIRLNPAPEQEPYFRQAAGNARFARHGTSATKDYGLLVPRLTVPGRGYVGTQNTPVDCV